MVGTFDSVATIVTDLVNATMSIVSSVVSGDNAATVIKAVVILSVVMIIYHFGKRYGKL